METSNQPHALTALTTKIQEETLPLNIIEPRFSKRLFLSLVSEQNKMSRNKIHINSLYQYSTE